ncbi:MAG: hypothetical protein J2P13_02560, partial [Acidobacteria bacterium]|nr:hypothetical protein [Acidobacteriota bacterium]
MRQIRVLAVALAGVLGADTQILAREVQSNPSVFEQNLREVRFALHIENGNYAGPGAQVLKDAVDGARYVLVGEDHITREIPQFTAILCNEMARRGLSAMAVEAGPQAAKFVSSSFGKPDRLERMAALNRTYPDSAAFLNIRQENDLAEDCSQVAARSGFHLWGLDQEFVGSAGWLLDQILATHLKPASAAAIARLKEEEKAAAARARKTGDPSVLFLWVVPDRELNEVAALLDREGNREASELFEELMESHEIYVKNAQGSPGSNSLRARLLKQNLRRDLEAAGDTGHQRVLLKFGDWHLYKGLNPLHQRD